MPRVSIITALYNHESYVGQAIESVLAQTYHDWEYLIWDDGSSDGALAVARAYASREPGRIRVLTHPGGANRGQERTRNAALDQATGELICILDSDDFYHPRKLEWLVPRFTSRKIGLAYGNADILVEREGESGGRTIPSGIRSFPEGRVFDELVQENFVCAGATLFRRECVDGGLRFDPSFRTIGEYPLWLKIARDWEFAHVPRTVATWRRHENNLGTRLSLQAKAELVTLCERLAADPSLSSHAAAVRRALARKRYDYANELYRGLELEGVRRECARVAGASGAAPLLRAKAALLYGASLLGSAPNRKLARLKRLAWEWRHPHARQEGPLPPRARSG